MKKIFSLFVLMLMSCMGAWAQVITSTPENPVPYGLKDVSAENATAFVASDLTVKNSGDKYGLFIFIETETPDYYKIYELKSQKYVHDKGDHVKGEAKTELTYSESDATKWHIRLSETANRYLISPEDNDGVFWNFYGGFGACESKTMGYYDNATDAGSKWFLVRTPFIGDPVTSLEDGGIYMPYCVGHSSYLEDQVGENDKRLYMTYDANFASNYTGNKLISFMWKMHASDGKWKMENLSSGRYIGNTNNRGRQNNSVDAASAGAFTVTAISDGDEQFSVKNDTYYWDANGDGPSSGTFTFWTAASSSISAGSNGAYKFYDVEGINYCQLADVAFGSKITNEDNFEFTAISSKQLVGFAANNDVTKLSFPYYTFTAATGETMVEAEGTKVYGTCTSALPLTANTFYAVHFRDGITTSEQNGFLYWNGSQAKCRNLTAEKATEETTWWFKRIEGTPYFSMHNIAKGADYGVTGGTTTGAITMTQTPSQLYPVANSTGTNGFQMVFSGTAYQLGDHKDGNLAIWADTRTSDQGSRMTIEDVTDDVVARLMSTITTVNSKIGTLGYPKSAPALADFTALNAANYFNAKAALADVYASTDIVLPEDGKAYYFVNYQMASNTNKTLSGNKWIVKYNDDYTLSTEAYTDQVATDANIFVARKVENNRFVFVTKDGRFLRYYGSNDNRAGALSENYSVNDGSVTINKQQLNDANTQVTLDECFGFVTLNGYRSASNSNADIIVRGDNGAYNATSSSIIRYNSATDQYSTAFRMIEVPDGNTNKVKLTNPNPDGTSGLNGKYVGTFSAPYAVELPNDVKAYTATVEGTTVTFNEINGNIVPKNVGVLLYAEGANSDINKNAVPAIEAAPTISENALVASTGEEIPVGSYILANKNNHVAFYLINPDSRTVAKNKAYLSVPTGSNPSAFRFDFEDENTLTGIETIESNANSAVYDLQGRRVQTAKSGLYIMGGKKVIR